MLRRLLLFIVISLLCLPYSWAAETAKAPLLSFEMFSREVLAYYPKLKAAHSDVDVALAKQMQAHAGFWPSLDLSAGYTITDDPVNVFGGLLRQDRFTSADFDLKRLNTPQRDQDFSAGVHVDLPLFDAMQTIYRTRSTRESLKAAESDESFTQMEAWLMAEDAYLNAVTLEKLSIVVDEACKDSDEDLQKAKDLKEKGMILGADYYAARVIFGDLTRIKNELVRQKKVMMALLNILMGEAVNKEWTLAADLKEALMPAQDLQQLLDAAFLSRQDLRALDLRSKALDIELARVRSTSFPNLSAFGDATNDRNKIGSGGGNNFTVGLKADVSLFDPARDGRVKEAKARKDRLEHDIQVFKDSIRREIVEELARHGSVEDNLGIFKGMTADASQAVSLMVPLYSEGRKSIKDLLEARRAYVQAVQSYDKALMGAWLSEGRLLFLSGRLDEDHVKQITEGAGL